MFRKKERHPYWTKVTLICFAIIILAVVIMRLGYGLQPEKVATSEEAVNDETFEDLLQQVLDNGSQQLTDRLTFSSPEAMQSEEVNFLNDDGDVVHTFITKPQGSGPFPGVVLLHGNESSLRAAQRASSILGEQLSQGLHAVVLTLDWRDVGFGSSGGDIQESIAYLRELPEVDTFPIVLMGLDYGAYLGMAELDRLDVQGVVAAYGFMNPLTHYQFLKEHDPAAALRFLTRTGCDIAVQPEECLADLSVLDGLSLRVPLLALHNAQDTLVNITQSQALVGAADAALAELRQFDNADAGHDFLANTSSSLFSEALGIVTQWMQATITKTVP